MSHSSRRTRATALGAAVLTAAAMLTGVAVSAPASAKPVNNTATITVLPAQVRLVPGESVTVRLQTNGSTGYTWSDRVVGRTSAISVVQNSPAALPANAPLGAPTTTDWVITAKAKGTAVVKFLSTPPGGKPSVVGSLTVIVRP